MSKRGRVARYWSNSTYYFNQQQRFIDILKHLPRGSSSSLSSSSGNKLSIICSTVNGAKRARQQESGPQAGLSTPKTASRARRTQEKEEELHLAFSTANGFGHLAPYTSSMLNHDMERLTHLIALNRQRKLYEKFYLRIKLIAYVHLIIAALLFTADVALVVLMWRRTNAQQQIKLTFRLLYSIYTLNMGIVSLFAAIQKDKALQVLPVLCIVLLGSFLLAPLQLPFIQSLVQVVDIVQYENAGRVHLSNDKSLLLNALLNGNADWGSRKPTIVHSESYVAFICLQVICCLIGFIHIIVVLLTTLFVFRILNSTKVLQTIE